MFHDVVVKQSCFVVQLSVAKVCTFDGLAVSKLGYRRGFVQVKCSGLLRQLLRKTVVATAANWCHTLFLLTLSQTHKGMSKIALTIMNEKTLLLTTFNLYQYIIHFIILLILYLKHFCFPNLLLIHYNVCSVCAYCVLPPAESIHKMHSQ